MENYAIHKKWFEKLEQYKPHEAEEKEFSDLLSQAIKEGNVYNSEKIEDEIENFYYQVGIFKLSRITAIKYINENTLTSNIGFEMMILEAIKKYNVDYENFSETQKLQFLFTLGQINGLKDAENVHKIIYVENLTNIENE